MDTVTLIRSAIRALLKVADAELRGLVGRDDDYAGAGKPVCDYDDPTARQALVDALARDAMALVRALDARELAAEVDRAARLLATVVGQDLEHGTDGVFRIARRVATDRVISTVDPQARHGHKTSARGFDGYKGHLAADPDTEIVTATTVTAANAGDAEPAEVLLAHDLPDRAPGDDDRDDQDRPGDGGGDGHGDAGVDADAESVAAHQLAVYGDAAYGAGKLLATLHTAGARIMTKVQPPPAPGGRFAKDRFTINLAAGTVTCPGQVSVAIRPVKTGGGVAAFGTACAGCPLAVQCTTSPAGRTVTIGAHEQHLARARSAQADPAWRADLHRNPADGGTQDRAPDAPPPRRAPRPRPGHPAMSGAVMPFSRSWWRALAASASSTLRGRPPLRPLAAAAASPARVRSIMVSRSSWANAAMMVSMAVPIGPSVCRPSVRLRNPIPRDVNWSTTARTCWVLRPSRSSFQTVSTSPSRRWSRQASRWGRDAVAPLTPWSV